MNRAHRPDHPDHEETPQSPETQGPYVREELDQDEITHTGNRRIPTQRKPGEDYYEHLGANEDEVVPVIPPMTGPADLVGQKDQHAQGGSDEELLDPREELTPG
jgi:hypothetical protein